MQKLGVAGFAKRHGFIAGAPIGMAVSAFHALFQFWMFQGIVLLTAFVPHRENSQDYDNERQSSLH
jgi:hypothetical protein